MARPNIYDLIQSYQAQPSNYSEEEVMQIAQLANEQGIQFSAETSPWRMAKNFGADFLDGLMLDAIPDNWKPNKLNNSDAMAGTVGNLASWLVPALTLAKGGKLASKGLMSFLDSGKGWAMPALKLDRIGDKFGMESMDGLTNLYKKTQAKIGNGYTADKATQMYRELIKRDIKNKINGNMADGLLKRAAMLSTSPLAFMGGYAGKAGSPAMQTMLAMGMSGAISGAGMGAIGSMADNVGQGDVLGAIPSVFTGGLGGAAMGGLMGGAAGRFAPWTNSAMPEGMNGLPNAFRRAKPNVMTGNPTVQVPSPSFAPPVGNFVDPRMDYIAYLNALSQ